jgi:CheY-like chemotaxis protein
MAMTDKLGTILLADDNQYDVELTVDALSECNLANPVVIVGDGAEALDFLYRRGKYATRAAGNPILFLLDIKMPKVNGLEVLSKVKSDPDLKVIPVVMLTSSAEEPDLRESYRMGANAYVVKPVKFQDFAPAVATVGKFWAVVNAPPPDDHQEKPPANG